MVSVKDLKNYVNVDDVLSAAGLCRKTEAAGFGTFVFGLGLGLIGGAAATLLLTPYNGTEAREKLAKGAEDLRQTVTAKVGELRGQGNHEGLSSPSSPEISYGGSRVGTI